MTEYEFIYIGGAVNTYLFRTSHGLFYEVKFKPTPYLFADLPQAADNVFELVIQLMQGRTRKTPADPAIPFTVAAICKDFFSAARPYSGLYLRYIGPPSIRTRSQIQCLVCRLQ